MTKDNLLAKLTRILAQGDAVTRSITRQRDYPGAYVDFALLTGFRSAGLSFIEQVFGKEHTYYAELGRSCNSQSPEETAAGIQILTSAKADIEDGFLDDVKMLLRAEVFADFLEMAEHLLEQDYKDAAAVMIGSVLEDHLHQLASKNDIDLTINKDGRVIPKKADHLNSELKAKEAYSGLDHKAVLSWLGLRNSAAHGKYSEYTKEQVQIMLGGVLDFVRRSKL